MTTSDDSTRKKAKKAAKSFSKRFRKLDLVDGEPPADATPAGFDPDAGVGSAAVAVLEDLWAAIRQLHPDVPEAVIVLASGTELQKIHRHGHWGAGRWHVGNSATAGDVRQVGEVFIAGERFGSGPPAVLSTVLHEAAHGLAHARGIRETSRQGRYHNKRFAALASELGLVVEKDPAGTLGWTVTWCSDEVLEVYVEQLAALKLLCGAVLRRGARGAKKKERKASSRRKLECSCRRVIRVSPSVAEVGPITCGVCQQVFVDVDADALALTRSAITNVAR